ncbi:MAG: P-loop domain protein [Bradyrhizobium sp.]|nr:P-loop domain protein [Bradyrhizobium sp.]
MADQSSETRPVIPKTMREALAGALSVGAEALLITAALVARSRRGEVGSEELLLAALAIGMPNSAETSTPALESSGSSGAPERTEAHLWLYGIFAGQIGQPSVDNFLRTQLRDAVALPTPKFGDSYFSEARQSAATTALAPQAQALLGRASFIACHTMQDSRFGIRHIVASLVLDDRNGNNAILERLFIETFSMRITDAAARVLIRATRSVRSDVAVKWKDIFANPPTASLEGYEGWTEWSRSSGTSEAADHADFRGETGQPSDPNDVAPSRDLAIITLSGFTSDSLAAGDTDPLGIDADVSAFARLVCLEQATPPLSICLFGEWGSGKSTFMERMQREIKKLTRPKPALEKSVSAKPPPVSANEPKFVENIVQIKFNAWHFADASLWASLTAVFFDQLRRGGSDSNQASDYKALIGKVADKVRSLEAGAANAFEKVEDARRKSDTAHKALDTAEKQLAANDLTLAWGQLQSDLEDIRSNNEDKLKEVGRRVYRDDLSADTKAFAAAVAEAGSIPGRVALIGRVLVGGGWPTGFGILAIVLVAAAGIGFNAIDTTNAATSFQLATTWTAGAFAALGALWQAFKAAQPIFDGAWKYAKAVEDARARLTKEAEIKRQEVKTAARGLEEAEAALVNARAPLSDYLGGIKSDAPSTILRYFLFEDSDVRDYDKQVGIVSRARRSFEQLNSIVTRTRMGRKAEARRLRGETLTSEEKEALAYWEEAADRNGLRVPDRIVLYIDDLDRCTHDQVYAVLQAIHLLLAFELFVVVVGVDVRWIEGAVAKHFEADTALPDDALQKRRRAIDYLEKIFQIPFWLQRLNTGSDAEPEGDNDAEPKGGSYARYVRDLLKDNKPAEPDPPPFGPKGDEQAHEDAPPRDDSSARDSAGTTSFADTEKGGEKGGEETGFGAAAAALASLKLEQKEIDFLASPEIGAIASKSPRAVKRLINVYRIVRARLSDREIDQFLGRSGMPPRYPIAILLAAIETGQPIESAELFHGALASLPVHERLGLFWKTGTEGAPESLLLALKALPAWGPAIDAVDRLCGEQGGTVAVYAEIARLVRRYSFNRYS